MPRIIFDFQGQQEVNIFMSFQIFLLKGMTLVSQRWVAMSTEFFTIFSW